MKIASLILIVFLIFSCGQKTESLDQELYPNSKIVTIMDSFVKTNKCSNCLYELYVDKKDPHLYEIVLYKGMTSLTEQENFNNHHNSVGYALSSGVKFKLYSGIEHYFNNSKNDEYLFKKIDTISYQNDNTKIWFVKDSFNIITIEERAYVYPFMPLPVLDRELKKIDIKVDEQ